MDQCCRKCQSKLARGKAIVLIVEVDPVIGTGSRWNLARVPLLLPMIPIPVPVDLPLSSIHPPGESWLRGTPRLGSGSPKADGASGCCKTGSRRSAPSGPRWRWGRLSDTAPSGPRWRWGTPRTSRCAKAAPRRCCRRSAPSHPC